MNNAASPNDLRMIERQRKVNKARRVNIAKHILKLLYRYRYFYALSLCLFLIGFVLAAAYFGFDTKATPDDQIQTIIMPTQLQFKSTIYSNPLPVTVSGNTESIDKGTAIDLKLSRVLSLPSTTKE